MLQEVHEASFRLTTPSLSGHDQQMKVAGNEWAFEPVSMMPDTEFDGDILGWYRAEAVVAENPGLQMVHNFPQQVVHVQPIITPSAGKIPRSPFKNKRSLDQRPKLTIEYQRTTALMWHILRSYPLMILNQTTLPPFIHPHIVSPGFEIQLIEPLLTCINLMSMINNGLKGAKRLFWRNVRSECEQMCAEVEYASHDFGFMLIKFKYSSMDKWGLLTSLQALTIYIIISLKDGETEGNDCDNMLVASVTVGSVFFAGQGLDSEQSITQKISQRLNQICGGNGDQSPTSNYDCSREWNNWVFLESCRR